MARTVNSQTILTCAGGYTGGSDGQPRFVCIVDSATSGKWQFLGGSCIRMIYNKIIAIK